MNNFGFIVAKNKHHHELFVKNVKDVKKDTFVYIENITNDPKEIKRLFKNKKKKYLITEFEAYKKIECVKDVFPTDEYILYAIDESIMGNFHYKKYFDDCFIRDTSVGVHKFVSSNL